LMDVGCANGFLLECLVRWGRERGLTLVPYGIDVGPRLIELAQRRLPQFAGHFLVGNGWDRQPLPPSRHLYAPYGGVPTDYLADYVRRLLAWAVAPGGRLIVGAYGSRSRHQEPFDVAGFLRSQGFAVSRTSQGGRPICSRFAWVDKP